MVGKRHFPALVAISLSLLAQAGAFPQDQSAAPARPVRGDRLAMYRAAGIDKDQEGKLFALTKDYETRMLPKTRTLIKLMGEMHAISLQPDPDRNTVLAKQDEINKANGELSLDRIKFALKMRAVLTPEQKQKFVELMQNNSRRTEESPNAPPPQGEQAK